MSEPRTRRQLSEALQAADHEQRKAAAEASAALREANRQASDANRSASYAERALDRLGFEKRPDADILDAMGMLDADSVWIPKADTPKTLTIETHEKIVDATIGEVQAGTRRETLAAVLNALEIKGYTHRDSLVNAVRELSEAHDGHAVSVRDRDRGPSYDTDRFWADIQVALEVRAERKTAERRAATEEKVSKIGKAPGWSLTLIPHTADIDFAAPRVSDLLGDPGPSGSYGSPGPSGSYGSPTTLDKPKTTKKSKGDKK